MFGKSNYPRLEITAGKQVGKIYKLKKGEYTLGTHKKCAIKLSGEYASELHAVIKLNAEGIWTLTNNSPNGTYVNQLQVDSVELDKFSTIQVGVENSLDFTPVHSHSASGIESEEGIGSSKRGKVNKWTWIVGAVLLVYLPAFAYLQQMGADLTTSKVARPVISLAAIENVTNKSRTYLTNHTNNVESSNQQELTVRSGSSLHEKVVKGAYANGVERDEMIKELIDQSKSHLTLAHHYVQMKLDDKAIKSLQRAMSVYPDHRFPSSVYASKTISAIKKRKLKKLN